MNAQTRPVPGRNDIEWVMGSNGPFIRDRPEWTAHHTREIEREREAERQRWLANHREHN